jgi:molybdopterin molybdotransferase
MQERTILRDGIVTIEEGFIKAGSNIRVKGNQLKKGDCGLQKGIVVSPAAIGFLCGIGCTEIKVFRKPKIGILTTGNELVTAGKKLKPGQIYESNQATLSAALMQSGYSVELKLKAKDKKELVKDAVKKILSACDVLIISGGISVGKYDFVKDVLTGLSVKELFYKVSQKPGKPLFVGKKGKQLIFAVPGNPAAALVCFYQYVLPALNKLSGFPDQKSSTQKLKSELMYSGNGDRSLFLKAIATQEKVRILDGQDSDNLQSFAKANALVYLPKDQLTISEGEIVDVFLFPEI